MKLFSIIIPVYNVEKYIDACVNSVISATSNLNDIEIILVDDGSTDCSGEKCDYYGGKYPDLIHVIHKKNGGLSSARNEGISVSVGEYILLLDSDDLLQSNSIDNLRNVIDKSSPDVIINHVQKFSDGESFYEEYNFVTEKEIKGKSVSQVYLYLLNDNKFTFSAWTFTVRKDLLINNSITFFEGILHEDELWTHDILTHCNSIVTNEVTLYLYRMNRPNSIMAVKGIKHLQDYTTIIRQLLLRIDKSIHDEQATLVYIKAADIYWSLLFNSKDYIDSSYEEQLLDNINRYAFLLKYCKDKRSKYIYYLQRIVGSKMITRIIKAFKQ